MRRYSVHHPSTARQIVLAEPDRLEFVKEGFCWPCLLVPLLWLIYRRQWLGLVGYVAAVMGSSIVLALAGAGDAAGMAAGLAVNFLMALHGNDLRRWSLSRRGYQFLGVIFAPGLDQAERQFFQRLIDGEHEGAIVPEPARATPPKQPDRAFGSEPVLGLFPTSRERQ